MVMLDVIFYKVLIKLQIILGFFISVKIIRQSQKLYEYNAYKGHLL